MDKFLEIFSKFVRKHTNVSSNIQDAFLTSAIRESTDIDLQETVGSNLYNKLIDLIETDTIKEHDKFMNLLNYVKYFVAYTTVARLAVISSVKIDNIGLNKTSDDKVESLDMEDIFAVEDHYYNKADVYKNRTQKYILANKEYFKEWLTNSKIDEIHSNLYSSSRTSIFLGGSRGKQIYK